MSKDYNIFLSKLKKIESGQRISLFNENLSLLPDLFFDKNQLIEIRLEAGGVIFRRSIPLNKELLIEMLNDKHWDARRWAALFLYKRFKLPENTLLKDSDWRCVVFGKYLLTSP